jgi:hypothetical protein
MLTEQENRHMPLRSSLWISAVAFGVLVASATAENNTTPPPPKTPPTPIVRTYDFPATGFAPSSETVRVTVVNIAPHSHNGTAASCNGAILFSDASGKELGSPIAFAKLGTGQIATGDYSVPPSGIPGLVLKRSELQGSVQVTIDPTAAAPCSLLLTLEVYDSTTYATHALVTAAVEEPIAVTPAGIGRGQ